MLNDWSTAYSLQPTVEADLVIDYSIPKSITKPITLIGLRYSLQLVLEVNASIYKSTFDSHYRVIEFDSHDRIDLQIYSLYYDLQSASLETTITVIGYLCEDGQPRRS